MRQWHNERKDPSFIIATRDVCLESFKAFCILSFEFVYGKKFIWSNHHDVIAESLMRLWTGDSDWRNLLINLPPRYSKTEMFCLFIAWAYGHNPACENMHLSFADSLVRRNSLKIKTIIKSQFFMDLFACRIDPEKDAIDEWRTVQGGLFYAASTGGQVTGTGAGSIDEKDENGHYKFCGMIWIDDPLKPKDAHTIRREQVNELWDETIKSRRNSVTTPVACIMQRIHEGDFSAELKSDTSECFKVVVMKALRDDGTSLWPMKHTVKMLEEMRDKNLYVFSAQYQQDPTPKGGTIFKGEWWKYTIELPVFERVEITADTAQKIKTHNDYSVFQAWGKASGRIYLIEQIRGKWEAPQLKDVAVSFIKRIKQQYQRLRAVNIEDKASGTGLIQSIKGETGVTINAIPRNIDKVTRAYDAAPHVQSGEVILLEGAPYCGIFMAECSSFNAEDTHLHDDQVDAMMDAVDIMLDKPKGASGFLQMA